MNVVRWLLAVAAMWSAAVLVNRWRVRRLQGKGEPEEGIVFFVEPVRWLFVIWGFSSFCQGLRRAGLRQEVRLFRWCTVAGALLVIPDLVRRRGLLRAAKRLASQVDALAMEHPGAPVHLVGYSSGSYIVLEACRRLRRPEVLGRVVLLAGAVSPDYRWRRLEGRVRGVWSFHSRLDAVCGIGPALFGSNDRRWGPACGAVGFRNPPAYVKQRAWRPADVRLGYLGDHFTISSRWFVARHIAPLLDAPF